MIHQPDKRHVILRFNQDDVFNVPQNAINRFADVRIQVHRIDNLYVLIGRGNFRQRMTNVFKTTTEAFPTMTGHQYHLFIRAQEWVMLCQFSS